jgi:hypothetical protein
MARRKAGLDPAFIEWPAARVFFRIHSARYQATQFHPGGSGDARFSPIYTRARKPISTLYAGETTVCALMETVFHEVPAPPGDYILDLGDLRGLMHSAIKPTRPLKLVDLSKKGLQRLGLKKTDLIETCPEAYPFTRRWAEQLHAATDADGLS